MVTCEVKQGIQGEQLVERLPKNGVIALVKDLHLQCHMVSLAQSYNHLLVTYLEGIRAVLHHTSSIASVDMPKTW
jgi:hypothetical protein